MLHAEGLVRRYGDRTVLHGVDVRADAGHIVAILGPNGAGKTTLLSLLAGLQTPDAGRVGRPPSEIGWIPQHPAVYRRLTVRENLELFARLVEVGADGAASRVTRTERTERVERMLDEAGLRERADDLVGTLSGGGQQRVNIAVGLLADPPVVLLDEPSSSLDPRQRERMWRFLTGLASADRAVVFSTHDVAEAERYADTILVLVDGRIAYAGTPAALAATADGDLLRAFVDLVERGPGDDADGGATSDDAEHGTGEPGAPRSRAASRRRSGSEHDPTAPAPDGDAR